MPRYSGAILRALRAIQASLESDRTDPLSEVLALPGVLEVDEPECDWEDLQGCGRGDRGSHGST